MGAVKMTLLLGLCFASAQGRGSSSSSEEIVDHWMISRCRPSADCKANDGYCINTLKGETCSGNLFRRECLGFHCACCVPDATKDECAEGDYTCPSNSECQDIEVGYECVCGKGFEQCGDVNECSGEPCGENSECVNTYGSYECRCLEGYQTINGTCEDINECADASPCGSNAKCQNSIGGFDCICEEGFEQIDGSCQDIDECSKNLCPENSDCENTFGGYNCTCQPGFESADGSCVDINECLSAECSELERCVNTPGSFACECKACAERCPVPNAIFVEPPAPCAYKIYGELTFAQAQERCASESSTLLELGSQYGIDTVGAEFWSDEDYIWLLSVPSSLYSFNDGDCLAMKQDSPDYSVEVIPCDSVLKAAFCSAKNAW